MRPFKFHKKLLFKAGALSVIVITSMASMAANSRYINDSANFNASFYLGVDAIYSNMKFRTNYGSNIFAKATAGINGFVGYMFTDSFGVEMGYEAEKKRKKTSVVDGGKYVAGWLVPQGMGSVTFISKVQQQHPYLGITSNANFGDEGFISTLVGVSLSHIHAQYDMVQPKFVMNQYSTFSKTKLVIMARLAIGYKLADHIAIRTFVTWRDTPVFKINSKENVIGKLIKLDNSFNIGLGLLLW